MLAAAARATSRCAHPCLPSPLGASILRYRETVFDLEASTITFVDADCGTGPAAGLLPLEPHLARARTSGVGSITPQTSFGEFSYWQYQQARDASKINDLEQREEKEASLGFNLSAIEAAVAEASADFYPNLVEDLEQAAADFKAMNERLREHCGHDAPPYTLVLDTLEEILRAVRFLAKDKLAAAAPEPQEETMVETGTSAGGSPAPTVTTAGGSGPIASREEALRRLEEVARYFRATEPHTPLVTGIERLVRWGRMPMNELILELVPDPTARAFYQHLTGAKLSAGEEDATQAYQATAGTSSENNNTGTATDDSNDNNDNGMSW